MRNAGGSVSVGESVFECLVDVPDELVGVDQIVVRGEVSWSAVERSLIECDGTCTAALSATASRTFLGVAANEPHLGVFGELGESAVDEVFVLLMRGVIA